MPEPAAACLEPLPSSEWDDLLRLVGEYGPPASALSALRIRLEA